MCRKGRATGRHHKFSQTKTNRFLYPEFIDHPENIVFLCNRCHMDKTIPKFTEREFCEHFGIKLRSKGGYSERRGILGQSI